MNLDSVIEELRAFPGIQRKGTIGRLLKEMSGAWGFDKNNLLGPGDDAAVMKTESGRYLLLAADGIMPALVQRDPFLAGRAAVLVNANDIYAMGGRPLAMVNVLSGVDEKQEKAICHGIREECQRLQVPMVGGHTSPEGESPFLAVSVVGEAGSVLADRNARAEQEILLAIDIRGQRWGDYLINWDSHRNKDSEVLCKDLGVLCSLADEGLCVAAKDISNAGILGSLAMLLEHADLGATVDLGRISVPAPFELADWLKVYPSFGFILICDPNAKEASLQRFKERGIWAGKIGRTEASHRLRLCLNDEDAVLFDFSKEGILNLNFKKDKDNKQNG